jgi:RND family efflux transporter MFP subunit
MINSNMVTGSILIVSLAFTAGQVLAESVDDEFNLSADIATELSGNEPSATSDWTTQNCLLEPHMVVELSSPVPGVIAKINVDRGDRVKKGDLVVQLRSEVEQALVNLNQSQLKFEETTVLRNQELVDQNLISPQERDELELKSDISRLELAASQARLTQKHINSPINGIVLERFKDPGEYVGEEPVLKIASLDPINVETVLPMRLFGSINAKTRAEVFIGFPIDDIFQARIAVVDQAIDAASGTFGLRLTLKNPRNKIPTGLKCKLRLIDGE